jgi:hypothetical protein
MIFMSTTSTTVCRGALQRKSNAAVTFTDSAARIFGWDNDKGQGRDTYNTLVIRQEMIDRIRAAADAADASEKW